MGFKSLIVNGKQLPVHKARMNPDFTSRTVLAEDTWEYVEMWLKRNSKQRDALVYWNQAQEFYKAAKLLPKTASPLTAYYCFLNAVKTLLSVNNIEIASRHGVSGEQAKNYTSLENEKVKFQTRGVLAQYCDYYGETVNATTTYSLKDLLYNLPFIHRAYTLTFDQPELFIPISGPIYVKKTASKEAWVTADINDRRFQNKKTLDKLPITFEQDLGVTNKFTIRKKNRFEWVSGKGDKTNNINQLKGYHKGVRKDMFYIYGSTKLWYIKRKGVKNIISREPSTLTFAVMHKLSEMSRYTPLVLAKHFDSRHNWLLSEFINTSLVQFIDEISSEITGKEFMPPGIRFK